MAMKAGNFIRVLIYEVANGLTRRPLKDVPSSLVVKLALRPNGVFRSIVSLVSDLVTYGSLT